MDEKEFRKELRKVEADAAARLDGYLPDELKRLAASEVEPDGNIRYIDGSPEDNQASVEIYREFMEKYVNAILAFPKLRSGKPKSEAPKSASPKRIYPKVLERRLHLLDFVLKRKGFAGRANWKQLIVEWNKEHPHDLDNLNNLKLKFYQALKDDLLVNTYIVKEVAPLISQAGDNIKRFWQKHPEAKNLNELSEVKNERQA